MLEANRKELTELFERRSKMEADFMDRYLAAVENYQANLEALRTSDAEDFHILKIRLETDIQNLEQHLETMRATYQLNTEKLEYNYRVLVERDHENQVGEGTGLKDPKPCCVMLHVPALQMARTIEILILLMRMYGVAYGILKH